MIVAAQSELYTRTVVGIALASLALGCLLVGGILFWILLAIAGMLMQAEWADLAQVPPKARMLSLYAIGVPLAIVSPFADGPGFLGVGLVMAAFFFIMATGRSIQLAVGALYVGIPVIALLYLREQDTGLVLALWALGVVWATDIGAYFAGRTIGGPKLAPSISPSKTWSGLGGGVLASLLFGFALHIWAGLPVLLAAASGLMAVLAQAGDLFESHLKRKAGVKDSGALLPGHGGVLDRLDGAVPVLPVAAIMIIAGLAG